IKWHATSGLQARPFIAGGMSLQHISGTTEARGTIRSGSFGSATFTSFMETRSPNDLARVWTEGIVTGAGLDFRRGWFHVVPELRYTRWINAAFQNEEGNRDRVELLVGVSFGK